MVNELVEKNSFGGRTWEIMFDRTFPIRIHEANENSFVVEFKEFRWVYFKTIFSFISNKPMKDTVIEAIDRVEEHFQKSKTYTWTKDQRIRFQKSVFEDMKYSARVPSGKT